MFLLNKNQSSPLPFLFYENYDGGGTPLYVANDTSFNVNKSSIFTTGF